MLTSIRTTKEKLLRAALMLVARDGFQAATTAAIADLAGVAEGTLYRHFPSKDDLLIEAYRRLKAEVFEAISDQDDSAAPPGERLKRLWRALFDAYRADTEAFMFGQRFGESALARREGGAAHEAIAGRLGQIARAGVAAGVFKDLPGDLISNFFFAPVGYMLKAELAGRTWSDADLEAAAQAVLDSWSR
ncbi:TetR/AcrR family transcriptional regulator [Phenylobacterium sp.]|jgi:AcrR family transcriptional regulator|uniref:TetR/AcrR family transcriptional regulator n=1 Tax=Phenylobacterium sp. TaxID=1871053 RepID=UPI002E2F00D9|nr:TetR/AcrR family transcriptional regulator [Phenylobacterium sp.]HEX2559609.1 TetR/AcrR family transcriptional regulator [Phenylobacterium sp.]